MRRYWFELTDEHYKDLGAAIPDGNNKQPPSTRHGNG